MTPEQRATWRNAAQAMYEADPGALMTVRPAIIIDMLQDYDRLLGKLKDYDDAALKEYVATRGTK